MPFDWSTGALAEGLKCYRESKFFEAHEHWESVWLLTEEPEKSFLQSLIQITAALHHFHTGNRAGAASLLKRAFNRLSHYPAVFGGIEVAPLREEISVWLGEIDRGSPSGFAALPLICPVDERPA